MIDPIYRIALISWNHLHGIFIYFHKKRGVFFTLITGRIIIFIFTYILNKEAFLQYHEEEIVGGRDFHTSLFPPIKKKVPLIKEKK